MAHFTVKAASLKKEIPDAKFGPAKVIALTLDNGDGTKDAEWFTRATTPIPEPGSTLEGELESGNFGLNFKKASGGGFGGGGGGMTPERQRAIQRQHSQEMALRIIAIAYPAMAEDSDSDDLRKVIVEWADFFDADVNDTKSAGTGGGGSTVLPNSDPSPVAGSSARKAFASQEQQDHFERLLKRAGAKPETAANIVLYAKENWTADGTTREAFDGLTNSETARPTAMAIAKRAEEWAANQPAVPEADTRDLPEPDGSVVMPDDEEIPF